MRGRTPLTPDELVDRLRLFSPGIVGDLYEIAMHGLATEEQRESRIDAKAHVLLLASAILMGVIIVAGALLRSSNTLTRETGTLLALYVSTLGVGLCASASALWVLFVSGEYRGTDEREVLNADELAAADKEFLDSQKAEKEERGNVRAQGRYRRLLIAHWWQLWQQHYAVHEAKAKRLRIAQSMLFCFLFLLMLFGVTLGSSVVRGA